MKRTILTLSFMLCLGVAFGQTPATRHGLVYSAPFSEAVPATVRTMSTTSAQQCSQLLIDGAGIITDPTVIDRGARTLIDQGADVHVVTVADLTDFGPRLADVERNYERVCPTWLSPAGTRKANLFVLIVAPFSRLKNAFFGASYKAAFPSEDAVNEIYSQSANPFFRSRQWGDGLSMALQAFGNKVVAVHDQAQHPVQNQQVTNNQATDYSPFAHAVYAILIVLGLLGLGYLVLYLANKRRRARVAQLAAVQARTRASNDFNNADATLPGYATLAGEFQRLSDTEALNPDTRGYSEEYYRVIAQAWDRLGSKIESAPDTPPAAKPAPAPEKAYDFSKGERGRYATPVTQKGHRQRQPPPAPVIVQNNNSGSDLLTGVVVGEMLGRDSRDDYEARRAQREEAERAAASAREADDRREAQRRQDDDDERRRRDDDSSSGSDSSFGSFGGGDSGGSGSDSGFGGGGGDSGGSGGDSSW